MNDELMLFLEPLKEGEIPKHRNPVKINGEWKMIETEFPDLVDEEIMETETYKQNRIEEFYDYVIGCKTCGTEFIAYGKGYEKVKNYCPGCGKKLI